MAVVSDPVKTNRGLRDRLGLTFPVLADPLRKVIKAYGVYDPGNDIAWPALVLVARDGRVRWRHVTDNYRKRLTTAEVLRRVGAGPASAAQPAPPGRTP